MPVVVVLLQKCCKMNMDQMGDSSVSLVPSTDSEAVAVALTSLKRSNSVPNIHDDQSDVKHSSNTLKAISNPLAQKARSFSESCSQAQVFVKSLTPTTLNRISQLKKEDNIDHLHMREVAHERELHSTLKMSQSYEDLVSLIEHNKLKPTNKPETVVPTQIRTPKKSSFPQSFECLTLNISSSSPSSSPTPTPTSTPSSSSSPSTSTYQPSPSPTNRRQSFLTRRSLSPLTIRPSVLKTVKRKLDDETSSQFERAFKKAPNCVKSPKRYVSSPLTIDPITTSHYYYTNVSNNLINNNNNNTISSKGNNTSDPSFGIHEQNQ